MLIYHTKYAHMYKKENIIKKKFGISVGLPRFQKYILVLYKRKVDINIFIWTRNELITSIQYLKQMFKTIQMIGLETF